MQSPATILSLDFYCGEDPCWRVSSPDLELDIRPLAAHHSRMKIPPLFAYIDIDYYEQLLEVKALHPSRDSVSQLRGWASSITIGTAGKRALDRLHPCF